MAEPMLILLYHDLESLTCVNEKKGLAIEDTIVDADAFDEQMLYLFERGYETLSIADFLSVPTANTGKKIIITFDDGHLSNYHLAFPILKKYGFSATFFIVGDRINCEHHMTADQIHEMAVHGMEIGSHGYTHGFLPLMTENEIRYELTASRDVLVSLLGTPIHLFAYPGGHYNKKIIDLLPLCSYKGACSCLQGSNLPEANPWLLKRIEIRNKTSIEDFAKIFTSKHIRFYQLIDCLKMAIRQTVGLERYALLRQRLYKFYLFKR